MTEININISIYGSLARQHGGRHFVTLHAAAPAGSTKAGLLKQLNIAEEERGYVFINAVLSDVPGLITDSDGPLKEGDHIGIFSLDYLWPYQYRDGMRMSANLRQALQQHGAMHHTYKPQV
jgi:hypothetical protein